ncbi:hypothetical protein KIL84_010527 [Mauremys mutica]|uniref:Uncharacterized protein n=1 Tax=Mauremys mutica TaxID=74926 RepID=A0A9D3XD35_9SAUR|nr:hypothetical protein KIL84_010527 [Mauremys mutica]
MGHTKPLWKVLNYITQPLVWLIKMQQDLCTFCNQPLKEETNCQKAGITGKLPNFLISECNLNNDCGNITHSSFYNKLQSTSVLKMWQHMVHKDCCVCARVRLYVCGLQSHAITSEPFFV